MIYQVEKTLPETEAYRGMCNGRWSKAPCGL